MQSTGSLINDILIFAVFIYLTLLVSGKVKLRQDRQEKFDELMSRRGTLLKILAYAGAVLFAILILITLFDFKARRQNRFSNVRQVQRQWTKADNDGILLSFSSSQGRTHDGIKNSSRQREDPQSRILHRLQQADCGMQQDRASV